MHGRGAPAAKPASFAASSARLLRLLSPDRWRVAAVLLCGVVSVALAVTAPKVLGDATNVIFDGVIGAGLQPGISKADQVQALRSSGQDQLGHGQQSSQGQRGPDRASAVLRGPARGLTVR